MARAHTMTPGRRAALKKAQLASARKRKGKHKKPIGSVGHTAAVVGGALLGGNAGALVAAKAGLLNLAGPASFAGAVGGGIAAHRKINRVNAKRRTAKKVARKTVRHGHAAQKGRRIA